MAIGRYTPLNQQVWSDWSILVAIGNSLHVVVKECVKVSWEDMS